MNSVKQLTENSMLLKKALPQEYVLGIKEICNFGTFINDVLNLNQQNFRVTIIELI